MAKAKRRSAAFKSLKKQFATTRNKMRRQYWKSKNEGVREGLHQDFKDLASAHEELGFGDLINFQGPPAAAMKRKGGRKG
jgi:hypothetical protein